jgi:hypothetical protein
MAKKHKVFKKIKKIKISVAIAAVLIILIVGLLLGYSAYINFFPRKANNYRIENKYYSFTLQTPRNWIAEGKALYSQENISQILTECNNDKSAEPPFYEIGRFRFKSQKYPQGFGDMGYFPVGFPSGAILDITINCIPSGIADKTINYSYGNLKIGGENAFEEFLDLPQFGKTKYIAFLHNGLRYIVNEYVFISPVDNGTPEEGLRRNYTAAMDKIISSLNFTK